MKTYIKDIGDKKTQKLDNTWEKETLIVGLVPTVLENVLVIGSSSFNMVDNI